MPLGLKLSQGGSPPSLKVWSKSNRGILRNDEHSYIVGRSVSYIGLLIYIYIYIYIYIFLIIIGLKTNSLFKGSESSGAQWPVAQYTAKKKVISKSKPIN